MLAVPASEPHRQVVRRAAQLICEAPTTGGAAHQPAEANAVCGYAASGYAARSARGSAEEKYQWKGEVRYSPLF